MSVKAIKEQVKEAYRVKLSKYKDGIENLSIPQRAKLYRMLLDEAIAETEFSTYTAEHCKNLNLNMERGC